MIDRVVNDLGRKLVEVPVVSNGLLMVCSTAASALAAKKRRGFLPAFRRHAVVHRQRRIIMCLLAAEITAVTGKNPQDTTTNWQNALVRRATTVCRQRDFRTKSGAV